MIVAKTSEAPECPTARYRNRSVTELSRDELIVAFTAACNELERLRSTHQRDWEAMAEIRKAMRR